MALEIGIQTVTQGALTLMKGVIKQFTSQLSEVDMQRGRGIVELMDEREVRSLTKGIVETGGYRGDIHQIVGFEDDEFGQADTFLPSDTEQIELAALTQDARQIAPVGTTLTMEVTVGRAVKDGQLTTITL